MNRWAPEGSGRGEAGGLRGGLGGMFEVVNSAAVPKPQAASQRVIAFTPPAPARLDARGLLVGGHSASDTVSSTCFRVPDGQSAGHECWLPSDSNNQHCRDFLKTIAVYYAKLGWFAILLSSVYAQTLLKYIGLIPTYPTIIYLKSHPRT